MVHIHTENIFGHSNNLVEVHKIKYTLKTKKSDTMLKWHMFESEKQVKDIWDEWSISCQKLGTISWSESLGIYLTRLKV